MKRILFVCLGNICRSPLAAGVVKAYGYKKNISDLIYCDSAGTAGYHVGAPPDHRSIQIANNHGIELIHRGRKFSKADFTNFDYIIAMDRTNYEDMLTLANSSAEKSKLLEFRAFDPEGPGDVPDPYYGSLADFEMVYQLCERNAAPLIKFILNEPI